ncbi:hypothetical protein Hypma_014061 [Hypsizygus marmoreus]|uniref:Uncharacterized protein n=1 Tax=Hypsizygus marmoreus TaxID=39966 RepID=A0A369K585_HYPMA|nr:hypothetical protein Hypma_014061 [Hypsizygus marmoreus]
MTSPSFPDVHVEGPDDYRTIRSTRSLALVNTVEVRSNNGATEPLSPSMTGWENELRTLANTDLRGITADDAFRRPSCFIVDLACFKWFQMVTTRRWRGKTRSPSHRSIEWCKALPGAHQWQEGRLFLDEETVA